jgi:hypothetical protein
MLKDHPYPPNAVASPRGGGRLVLVVEGVSVEYEFMGECMINCTGLWDGYVTDVGTDQRADSRRNGWALRTTAVDRRMNGLRSGNAGASTLGITGWGRY